MINPVIKLNVQFIFELSNIKKGGKLVYFVENWTELGIKNEPINNPKRIIKNKKGKYGIFLKVRFVEVLYMKSYVHHSLMKICLTG